MQVCSCLWGGPFNPIIPIAPDVPGPWKEPPFDEPTGAELAKGYLDFFEPDVFVECEPGIAAQVGLGDMPLDFGEPRVVSIDTFFEYAKNKDPIVPFGLSIASVYQDVFDREFKFVRRQNRRVVVFERNSVSDSFIDAAFGGFPDEGFLSPLAMSYIQAFEAEGERERQRRQSLSRVFPREGINAKRFCPVAAMKNYRVYIMSGRTKTLYVSVTNDIERRTYEHRNKSLPGFISKYGLDRLVYLAEHAAIRDAIEREKQIKSWRREKKVALIESLNPSWRDLSLDWQSHEGASGSE
jgi:putative endonuclease